MPVRKETWPIEALPHEEALTPVVESFLAEGLEFDFSQSGMRQLYDRIDELAEAATKANLLDLVSNILGELDCLAICTSCVIEESEQDHSRESQFKLGAGCRDQETSGTEPKESYCS